MIVRLIRTCKGQGQVANLSCLQGKPAFELHGAKVLIEVLENTFISFNYEIVRSPSYSRSMPWKESGDTGADLGMIF